MPIKQLWATDGCELFLLAGGGRLRSESGVGCSHGPDTQDPRSTTHSSRSWWIFNVAREKRKSVERRERLVEDCQRIYKISFFVLLLPSTSVTFFPLELIIILKFLAKVWRLLTHICLDLGYPSGFFLARSPLHHCSFFRGAYYTWRYQSYTTPPPPSRPPPSLHHNFRLTALHKFTVIKVSFAVLIYGD